MCWEADACTKGLMKRPRTRKGIVSGILKTCTKCKKQKDTSEFNRDKGSRDGLNYWCIDCTMKCRLSQREWVAGRTSRLNYFRDHKYSFQPGEFQKLMDKQRGKCAACGIPFDATNVPHVDHDHDCCPLENKTCGECTRGLLCASCNKGLGLFRDDIEALEGAIKYLKGYVKFEQHTGRVSRKRSFPISPYTGLGVQNSLSA